MVKTSAHVLKSTQARPFLRGGEKLDVDYRAFNFINGKGNEYAFRRPNNDKSGKLSQKLI